MVRNAEVIDAMGMQNAWAAGMPGVAPTYDPNMAIHHGLNLPGGMGQFKDPAMNPSMGQGCESFPAAPHTHQAFSTFVALPLYCLL